jgi:serine protease Do
LERSKILEPADACSVKLIKIFPEDSLDMSRKNLVLTIALMVAVGAIAGGVVYAQEASVPKTESWEALVADTQEWQEPNARNFSFFLDGGAFLGIGTEDISKDNMARYGMHDVRGVGVTEITKDSPAEKAGLRKDDVILRFDGEAVTSVRKLTRLVSEHAPDQTVRITISRAGAEQELSATLAKHKFENVFGSTFPRVLQRRGDSDDSFRVFPNGNWPPSIGGGEGPFVWSLGANRRIGVSTQTLSKQLADYFGVKDGGALITSVTDNSPAAKAGLKAGDVITAIDGEKVAAPGDVTKGLNKKETGDVTLTIIRDHNTRTVTLTPEKNPDRLILRPDTTGARRITMPSIVIPTIPEMNIRIPQIVVPATPPINITVPSRAPRATRTRTVII